MCHDWWWSPVKQRIIWTAFEDIKSAFQEGNKHLNPNKNKCTHTSWMAEKCKWFRAVTVGIWGSHSLSAHAVQTFRIIIRNVEKVKYSSFKQKSHRLSYTELASEAKVFSSPQILIIQSKLFSFEKTIFKKVREDTQTIWEIDSVWRKSLG